MKHTLKIGALAVIAALSLAACKENTAKPAAASAVSAASAAAASGTIIAGFDNQAQQTGYAIGSQIAGQVVGPWQSNGIKIDNKLVIDNLKKVAAGGEPDITQEEAQKFMAVLAKSMQGAASNTVPKLDAEQVKKLSILMGAQLGGAAGGMQQSGLQFDLNSFEQAVSDIVEGKSLKMTPEQVADTLKQAEKAHADAAANTPEAKANKEKGEAFLKENADKEGVKTTASGLQYKITKQGNGKQPTATDAVTVDYTGKLVDGTQFDAGKGVTFPLNQVIPGWTEGFQLLKEGDEATLFIPAELAYGKQSAGDKIAPNSTLVFDVKLIKVGQ